MNAGSKMNKLKYLKVCFFQKHKELEIYFDDKVNILCGETGCGKSTVRRAIEFLLNEPVDNPIKDGQKSCKVIAGFDNSVEVERIRSASINRYILRQNGEEVTFDSVGKNLPEEIQKIFGFLPLVCDKETINLNIAKQITLPFLMDKTGTFRSKLFSQLTGNALIDELLGEYNKENFNINKEVKIEEKNLEQLTKDNDEKSKELEKVTLQYKEKHDLYGKIKEKFDRFVKLQEIFSKLNNCYDLQEKIEKEQKEIKLLEVDYLEGLRKKIDRFDQLNRIKTTLKDTIERKKALDAAIKELGTPGLNIKEIEGKLKRYETLKSVFDKLKENREKCIQISGQLEKVDIELKEIQKEKAKFKLCPECNGIGVIVK